MENISPDMSQYMRLIFALTFVLALMGGLTILLKKLGLATAANIKSGDKRRLKIVESLPLDARRRLMIVQCDEKQHLVILGLNNEIVVDQDIPPVDSSTQTKPSAS